MRYDIAKYSADQPRDDRGRWTAGDPGENAAAAFEQRTLAPHADADTRGSVRGVFRAAMSALHDTAANLADKARQAVTSTRFAGIRPTHGGGVEISATHSLPGDNSHLQSYAQLHPWQVDHPATAGAIMALNGALLARGVPSVPVKAPAVGVTFKNGPAP